MTTADYEITSGAARAVITRIGAGLRAYEVAGVPYLETFPEGEHPPLGAGAVLVPWPNRVDGGVWRWQGTEQHLPITEPDRGHAIHGLVRNHEWQVLDHKADRIELAIDIPVQPGWPVALRTTIGYVLDEKGLSVTHGVENLGEAAVPFGVGTHPYPRAGNSVRQESELQLAGNTVLPLDPETLMPSGPAVPVEGTEYDFRKPRSLADYDLDTPFGDCQPEADGLIHHRLTSPHGGIEMWADPDFRWVQAFTPPAFPGRADGVVAFEPMTCPPNALNSGEDLITLEPGQSWSGRWGLHPLV
ncbi:MAG TPA: aldose 1-epimerase family protein [Pseudonocardiaceae bacterium]|jgi:aldose 1-epimerase|nr:aldose 1-epimerase family protein [Pseudonocardiaceae bacterium]